MKMTDLQKCLYGFLIGMVISTVTAWWWFGNNPHPSFALWILHGVIGAATVACGFGTFLAYIIELDKKKK